MKGLTVPLQPQHNNDPLSHALCSRQTDPLPTPNTPELPYYSSVAPACPQPRKTLYRSVQRPTWAVPFRVGPPQAQDLGPSVPRLLASCCPRSKSLHLWFCLLHSLGAPKGKADTLLDSLHCPHSMAGHRKDVLCG